MLLRRRALTLLALAAWGIFASGLVVAATADAPALLLARIYHPGLDLQAYWVSEKYDGVRGHWDGQSLRTRGGEAITPPAWFTAGWPDTVLDGELWAGRGQFAQAQSTVRQASAGDAAWRQVRFMVFDVPAHPGDFDARLPVLKATVARIGQPWVVAVTQERVASHAALQTMLQATVRGGGEGLMLHLGASLYRAGRSDDLIKVKTHSDAEARVIAHLSGKGKHAGRLGALLVEMPTGQQFRLGTGLSDADRDAPPAVGRWVTYRFQGTHASGLPRFARFVRIREDMPVH